VAEIFTREPPRARGDVSGEADEDCARRAAREVSLRPISGSAGPPTSWWADSGAVVIVEKRGQRAAHDLGAQDSHLGSRDRENHSARAGSGDVSQKLLGTQRETGQLLSVYTSVFCRVQGAPASGRSGRVLRGAARQRPHQAAAPTAQAAVALLHSLRRVASTRARCTRKIAATAFPGSIRGRSGHHYAAVHGRFARAGAAVCGRVCAARASKSAR